MFNDTKTTGPGRPGVRPGLGPDTTHNLLSSTLSNHHSFRPTRERSGPGVVRLTIGIIVLQREIDNK